MPQLLAPRQITLRTTPEARRFVMPPVSLHQQTATLTLRLKRPTALAPIAWASDATVRVSLILDVDGVKHHCTGQATGGIRKDANGQDAPEYVLCYSPSCGFFGATDGPQKRLGETAKQAFMAWLEIELVSGECESAVEVATDIIPAPTTPPHSSVVYDTASSTQELAGDGTVSWSHTGTGSNLAVQVGMGSLSTEGSRTFSSGTYGATSLVSQWDQSDPSLVWYASSGAGAAGISSGVQTVTVTMSGGCNLFAGAITATGVDQTTPFGTPVEAAAGSGGPSVTVGSVGADDLVVDCYIAHQDSGNAGVGQTERWSQIDGFDNTGCESSTQLGSSGGVMSWTAINSIWCQGAVAFKPVSAAAGVFTSGWLVRPEGPAGDRRIGGGLVVS